MVSQSLLHFAEYDLQIIALAWLVALYAIKIFQYLRLPSVREKAPSRGSASGGVLHAYGAMFMPWSMESSRKHPWRWLEFALYHIGAGAAILNTFTMPFVPGMMTQTVRVVFAVLIVPAFIAGLFKLARRVTRPEMRAINTPDDYFSLAAVEVFFASAIVVLVAETPLWRTVYFFITAGFLFYVPFSKISHYIYFLLAATVTGSRYGWRGVRPQPRRVE